MEITCCFEKTEVARPLVLELRLKRAGARRLTHDRPIEIGLRKQLLVDDYTIQEKQGVRRELAEPEKMGVVLEPSLPTDFHPEWKKPHGSRVAGTFGSYLTVLRDEKLGKFRMYYTAHGGVGYAESTDGVRWTKPLVSRDGKSNIVFDLQQHFTPVLDEHESDPAYRYKAAYYGPEVRAALAYSADGLRWQPYNEGEPVTGRAADTHNQLIWDPIEGKYRLTTRTDLGAKGGAGEIRAVRVMYHKNNDLAGAPEAWYTAANAIHVDDPKHQTVGQGQTPRRQLYAMPCWVCGDVYFGLMDVYEMSKTEMFDGFEYETRHDDDVMDFYIGTSRDGVNFDKSWVYAHRPFVPRGPAGSFDKDGVRPPSQLLTHGDAHWIYYTGLNERHYSRGRDNRIALAKLPLDRFVCLEAGETPGTVLTKPFPLEGAALEINVDAGCGAFQVDVFDRDGKPLAGYSGADARPHKSVDALRFRPAWKTHRDLSGLKGCTVRLRFSLRDAKLYAFQIVE